MYVYVCKRVIACECSLVSTIDCVREGPCTRMCTCKCLYVCAYVVKEPEKERVYTCDPVCACVCECLCISVMYTPWCAYEDLSPY